MNKNLHQHSIKMDTPGSKLQVIGVASSSEKVGNSPNEVSAVGPLVVNSGQINQCPEGTTFLATESAVNSVSTRSESTPILTAADLINMQGGKTIFLSDQFTAVLIKPESLLYGVEVPVVKNEAGEIVGMPATGEAVSESGVPWLVQIGPNAQAATSMQDKKLPPPLVVPKETAPDAASATPSAPYMFEGKDRAFCCEFCPNIRFTRGQLRRHKAVHSGQRNYACSTCGKRFAWKHSLLKHSILHTGESPFSCNQCGKVFSAAHHLRHHLNMHYNEKPYNCTQCDKTFTRPDDLILHARLHTGQETYTCETCAKSFTTKFGLNTHMRIHTENSGKQLIYHQGLVSQTKADSAAASSAGGAAAGSAETGSVLNVRGNEFGRKNVGVISPSGLILAPNPSDHSQHIIVDQKKRVASIPATINTT